MLAQALPTLMQGAGAAAFHGLIRAAYALAANHAEELADALAYWSCRWFACGAADGAGSNADTAAVLKTLDFAAELNDEPLIAQQMAQAAAHPRFAPALARWRVDAHITLPRLAMLAAERYAARAEFTVLHLVTSAHAVQRAAALAARRRPARGAAPLRGAAAAAWATLPRDHKGAALQVSVLPWTEIAARADRERRRSRHQARRQLPRTREARTAARCGAARRRARWPRSLKTPRRVEQRRAPAAPPRA